MRGGEGGPVPCRRRVPLQLEDVRSGLRRARSGAGYLGLSTSDLEGTTPVPPFAELEAHLEPFWGRVAQGGGARWQRLVKGRKRPPGPGGRSTHGAHVERHTAQLELIAWFQNLILNDTEIIQERARRSGGGLEHDDTPARPHRRLPRAQKRLSIATSQVGERPILSVWPSLTVNDTFRSTLVSTSRADMAAPLYHMALLAASARNSGGQTRVSFE